MARVTERIRLGPAALNPFTLHPYEIAGQTAMLDLVSGGRAYLGLVKGAWLDRLGLTEERPLTALREAVEIVQRERPGLVLMDVTMPGTSGWNAVRTLKEDVDTMGVPIIVVTGLVGSFDRDASLAAGADEHLDKPVSPQALLREVRRFLPR